MQAVLHQNGLFCGTWLTFCELFPKWRVSFFVDKVFYEMSACLDLENFKIAQWLLPGEVGIFMDMLS